MPILLINSSAIKTRNEQYKMSQGKWQLNLGFSPVVLNPHAHGNVMLLLWRQSFMAKQLFQYSLYVAEESKVSSSWSQKPAIGHGLNQVNPINAFETNLSKPQFRLCLDFQSGICTLKCTTQNFVSISFLYRAWRTSQSSYPPRRI